MLARRFGARRRLVMVAAIATLVLFGGALVVLAAAPPFIDAFNTNQASGLLTVGNGGTASDSTTNAGDLDLLRGNRNVYVNNVVAPAGQVVLVNVTAGKFTHSQNSQTTANSVLTYDGAGPGYPSTLFNGLCTPGCVDLTQGSTTNGFTINVDFDDLQMDVRVRVYDGSGVGRWSERTFINLLPGATSGFSGPVFVEFPSIASGTSGPNGPANFANVGAVEIEFIGKLQATDLTIDSISTAVFDWGDLPETSPCASSLYATTMACQGPRHVVTSGLRLGATIDPGVSPSSPGEINGQPTVSAKGDDIATIDDEDGVVPVGVWSTGSPPLNGGTVQVTVQGSGRLVGWIDWAGNGFQASDVIINQDVSSSTSSYSFLVPITLPASPNFVTLYARFRLFPRLEVNPGLWQYAFDGRDQSGVFTPPLTPPGQSKGGEVEDHVYYVSSTSLAVTLASFTADAQADGVRVGWETTSEINNAGFNLYRAEAASGAQTKLNADLIPSQAPGSTQGALYEYLDANVASGQTYWYWLESVDISGATTLNGPVSVDVSAPTAVTLANLQADTSTTARMPWLVAVVAVAGLGLVVGSRRRRNSLR